VKAIQSVEDHLVVHDATTIGVSAALGAAATVITGDLALGAATTSLLTAAGIGGMSKIGPMRRGVNRAAIAVADMLPERKK